MVLLQMRQFAARPHISRSPAIAASPGVYDPFASSGAELAKPNYRHQKKQKELARKARNAEKQRRRTGREAEPEADAPAAPAITDPAMVKP